VSTATPLAATDADRRAVRDTIYRRTGIAIPASARPALDRAIADRTAELGLDSPEAYTRYLTVHLTQSEEIEELLERTGCLDSAFFRDPAQLVHFEHTVLPALLAEREGTRRLRIWSAACGSGHEPYTLAIILRRALGLRIADWRIEIVATDVSARALDRAREAIYSSDDIRSIDAPTRADSFQPDGARWSVAPELRAMVTLTPQSLRNELAPRRRGPFDAIFCRDTLRLFDDRARASIVESLRQNLAPGGTLFLTPGDLPASAFGPCATIPAPAPRPDSHPDRWQFRASA
jgi:chemotaxis protein methyltransferase CheR